jgi:putative SOS response-associated peptidase YedK
MCGRYTLIKLSDFTDMFPWIRAADEEPPDRYNIAPTQPVPIVANRANPRVEFVHWGLIPSWAKEPSIGSRMINARAETLATKPAFRAALKRRRCLIPASGFYEWKKLADSKTKQPMYIRLKSHAPFAFAGLWEVWHDDKGKELPSCTIVTGEPNALVKTIHDRMAVILPPERYRDWLDPGERPAEELQAMLTPYPPELMEAYPIGRQVNNPSHESADCIEPLSAEPPAVSTGAPKPAKKKSRRAGDAGDDQGKLF